MARCRECGADNPPGNAFCGKCGVALITAPPEPVPVIEPHVYPPPEDWGKARRVRCLHCGRVNAAGNRYCDQCTTELTARGVVRPKPDHERQMRIAGRFLIGAMGGLVLIIILIAVSGQSSSQNGAGAAPTASNFDFPTPTPQDTPLPGVALATALPSDTPTAEPLATPTQTAAQWAIVASTDTYADVNDHPDAHGGDKVVWTCRINKFLPASTGTLDSDVTCQEFAGNWDGSGDGEIELGVPWTIDVTSMHTGDFLKVYGVVDQPMQGTNGFGATITEPRIVPTYLMDLSTFAAAGPQQ